jgi:hypothetical protein
MQGARPDAERPDAERPDAERPGEARPGDARPDDARPDEQPPGAARPGVASPVSVNQFVAKWLQREPEMQFAALFCAPAQRARFDAWGALLHELREARFELREPAVADAKRAWWASELGAIGAGQPRHPLGFALSGTAAPWTGLARALAGSGGDEPRPADLVQSLRQLEPLASAAVAVEAALFDTRETPEAAHALAVHWRLQQLPRGLRDEDIAGLPMSLLARHGLTRAALSERLPDALLRDWAGALGEALPVSLPGAASLRRARARFDKRRLARLARSGRDFDAGPAPALLWMAWRAARGG